MASNSTPVASNFPRPIPGTPVFDPPEQEALQRDPHLRPYAGITKAQLYGLLAALGEYATRVEESAAPMTKEVAENVEAVEAHRALLAFYSRWHRSRPSSTPGDFVFNSEERYELAHHKYVRGCEDVRKGELIHLLEMLARYSNVASKLEQTVTPWEGVVRTINAHNALIDFRERPLTLDEFKQSVWEAVSRFSDPSDTVRS